LRPAETKSLYSIASASSAPREVPTACPKRSIDVSSVNTNVQYFALLSQCGPKTGECIVATSKEYREYADECFGWAKTAKSDREREIFLQMAKTWLAAFTLANLRERPEQQCELTSPTSH